MLVNQPVEEIKDTSPSSWPPLCALRSPAEVLARAHVLEVDLCSAADSCTSQALDFAAWLFCCEEVFRRRGLCLERRRPSFRF